ncbi:MAG TPA: hypothetical protein DCW90_14920 [Lachnospiraceae bacterium]|nr:acyl carrier protein [uncultured Lachnoclostridium sp.]HAU86727.1 hypothetical protein [Lachnospiraceae bacterium]
MKVSADELYEVIESILELDEEKRGTIKEDDCLRQFGLTSIKSIKMLIMLEQKYEISFRDEDLLLEKSDSISKLKTLLENY